LRVDDVPPAAEQVLLLRTAIVGASESGGAGTRASSRELFANAQAQKLDVLLGDAIQDLGLTLDLSNRSTQETSELTDVELVARAAKGGRWVIYPSIDARGSEQVVRLAAVAPGTKAVIVRVEVVKPADLAVRAVVMLRDVVSRRLAVPGEPGPPRTQLEPKPSFAVPARSQGRAILACSFRSWRSAPGWALAPPRSWPKNGTLGSATRGTSPRGRGGRPFQAFSSPKAGAKSIRRANTVTR
jgi:hypothetical protein